MNVNVPQSPGGFGKFRTEIGSTGRPRLVARRDDQPGVYIVFTGACCDSYQ